MKIIVGAGGVRRDGWQALQQQDLDIIDRNQWARLFQPASIAAILTEHTLEHLTPVEAANAVSNFYHYLKPGGYVRCAVPDGFHPDPAYLNWVAPNSDGERWLQQFRGSEPEHKTLWNYFTLAQLFADAGFMVALREWFDEWGVFHRGEWATEDGYIRRRFGAPWSNLLSGFIGAEYTSLIIDGIKR